jgi:NarL family two-component system sensor histidine kinase LiaS
MSMLKNLLGLRWKLVVSYVVVTLATVLVLEGLVILGANWLGAHGFGAWWTSRSARQMANELAGELADPMVAGSEARVSEVLAGATRLELRLVTAADANLPSDPEFWRETRVVVGPEGRVLASDPPESYPVGALFVEPVFPEGERLVGEALRTGSTTSLFEREEGLFAAAVPIFGDDGEHLGAVYYRRPVTDLGGNPLAGLGSSMLTTTVLLLPVMIPLGLIFGFVTATGFTRRLRRLTDASSALAGGDLSSRVDDRSRDEIGRLARQFNAMAAQIETDTERLRELADHNARLAEQAQRAAALEERHRLARELHDGVKQNLFGVSLATSAALNLIDSEPEAARARLREAGELSRMAHAEMQALLNELRPAGLDDRGLVAALEDYATAFGRREGLEVEWRADEDLALPLIHEQILYRVAQEVLTNVARHAEADRVTVRLHTDGDAAVLEVVDNGRGFDAAVMYAGTSMGLQGMRERLAGIGGTFELESAPGEGTRITARVTPAAEEVSDG